MTIPSKAETNFIIWRAGLENQGLNLRRKGYELGKGRHDCRQTIIQSILYLNCVSCNIVLLGMSDSIRLSTLPGLTTPLYALAVRVEWRDNS
jgi:hypothetical protein